LLFLSLYRFSKFIIKKVFLISLHKNKFTATSGIDVNEIIKKRMGEEKMI